MIKIADVATPVLPSCARLPVLRATFPGYTFRVIYRNGRTPHYEALSTTGGSPWCLTSDDIGEIWRELKAVAA